MIFDQQILNIRVLDVMELNQGTSDTFNKRGYHALSFRVEADTQLSFAGRTIHAGSGTVGYFPANLSYRRQSIRDRMLVIHFDTGDYHSGSIEMITLKDSVRVHALFREALSAWKSKELGFYYHTLSCFYEIMAILHRESCSQSNMVPSGVIQLAVDYMNRNLSRATLSVAETANYVGISEAYLRRQFRAVMGQSPRQYLIGKRISYATSLLDSGMLSVQQVAEQSGFSEPKYFSTVFKQIVGCSPSAYLYHWTPTEEKENK